MPYKNTKLTHLLKDCFGGNCRTLLLCTVSEAAIHHSAVFSGYLETASKARLIINKGTVNSYMPGTAALRVMASKSGSTTTTTATTATTATATERHSRSRC